MTRWHRLGLTVAAVIGLTAGAQALTAGSAYADGTSSASADLTCYAAAGSQGSIGCVKVHGDIFESITGVHNGTKENVSWQWDMDTTKVKRFRVGAFVFDVSDCTANKVIWHKSYDYGHGTTRRSAGDYTSLNVAAGHTYYVSLRAYGTYDRKFPNGSVANAYIGTGPGGQDAAHGGCR